MKLSVIIPTYNESSYISKCLASLLRQDLEIHDKIEIIVIDDGSTDNTPRKVKQFSEVKLLHNKHAGPAICRNAGSRHASGAILLFLDADMEFESQFVRQLILPIKQGQVKGTFSKQELVANWQNPIARCWNWNQNLPARARLPANHPNIGTDFRAILKSEFDRVKGFDDTGYTDTWTLSKKLGYKPVHAPGAVFYHHNPSTYSEVFRHATWVSKREYKHGALGTFAALVRASLPVSIVIGCYKAIKYREPTFLPYKVVYDFGNAVGIIKHKLTGQTAG